MKIRNIIIVMAVAAIVVTLFYSFRSDNGDPGYIAGIQKEREEKDAFMRSSSESPFADDPKAFKGLQYYPPDPKYRIVADLTPVEKKQPVVLATSDGKEQHYIEYAYANFDLDGYNNRLLILEIMDMGPFRGKLFLSFADATSANDTYGAGRYLDVAKVPGSKTITLDFNKAYNPYCAYSEKFSCPLPPASNLLSIPIRAGEKTYSDEH